MRHPQTAHGVEDVAQGAVAEGADVLGGDDGNGRRGIADLPRQLVRGDDLGGEQLLERQLGDVVGFGC